MKPLASEHFDLWSQAAGIWWNWKSPCPENWRIRMKAMMMMNPPIVVILPPSLVRPDLLKTTKQLWITFIWQHVSTLCSIWTHQRVFDKLHINPQITCAWRFEAVCHRRSNQGPIMHFTQLCNRKNEREMISEHRNKWIDIFLSSSNWMHLSDPHWS